MSVGLCMWGCGNEWRLRGRKRWEAKRRDICVWGNGEYCP